MRGKPDRSDTLCWKCEKACGRCPWSHHGAPIEGWQAELAPILSFEGAKVESYEITTCPLFEMNETPHQYKRFDEKGIRHLAAAVLLRAVKDRRALVRQMRISDEGDARILQAKINYLEKVFDPYGLWTQLAGLDESGLLQAVRKETVCSKTEPPSR